MLMNPDGKLTEKKCKIYSVVIQSISFKMLYSIVLWIYFLAKSVTFSPSLSIPSLYQQHLPMSNRPALICQ